MAGQIRRRRWVLVLLVVAAVGAYGVYEERRKAGRTGAFADLDTALAAETRNGWSVAVPPKRGGPYRVVVGGMPAFGAGEMVRIRGKDGEMEEVRLDGGPDFVQKVVELDTPDGHRTLVVLKRTR